MAAKGYLRVESVDGVNRYEPVVDRERTLREAVEEFLVDVMDGTVGPVLAQLADTRRLSADDVERLRELVPEDDEPPAPEDDAEEETP
jgi:predicted transcriptional regulator